MSFNHVVRKFRAPCGSSSWLRGLLPTASVLPPSTSWPPRQEQRGTTVPETAGQDGCRTERSKARAADGTVPGVKHAAVRCREIAGLQHAEVQPVPPRQPRAGLADEGSRPKFMCHPDT